jgi:hypothetical protein
LEVAVLRASWFNSLKTVVVTVRLVVGLFSSRRVEGIRLLATDQIASGFLVSSRLV